MLLPDIVAHSFREQTRLEHAGMVVVGVVLAVGVYLLVVRSLGDSSAVSADGAAATRRLAVGASGVALGLYLAVAFVRGYGGPLLNLLYLMAHLLLTPGLAVRTVGDPMPAELVLEGILFTPTFVGETLQMALLPVLVYIGGHMLWFRGFRSRAERIAWAERHMPSLYRNTIVDPAFGDRTTPGGEER